MNQRFDPIHVMQLLDDTLAAARTKITAEFMSKVYNEGVQHGRDLEFRTAQEHEEGMKKMRLTAPLHHDVFRGEDGG